MTGAAMSKENFDETNGPRPAAKSQRAVTIMGHLSTPQEAVKSSSLVYQDAIHPPGQGSR